jgi:hypothetical protein
MESWKRVWREGIAPLISTEALKALAVALETDDKRLLQGATTSPSGLLCVQDWPVEAGCALGYCGIIENGGFGTATVAQTEKYFGHTCYEADLRFGEPAAVRFFLNAFDEWRRDEMIRELLPEVQLALQNRS